MTKSFSIWRSLVMYNENISNGRQRLLALLQKNHSADQKTMVSAMEGLLETSVPNLQKMIDRCKNTMEITETLLETLKNESI